jgi:hypothetical protein
VPPTDHDRRAYYLGLRLTVNSLLTLSDTKEYTTPYEGPPWFVRNDALQQRPSD